MKKLITILFLIVTAFFITASITNIASAQEATNEADSVLQKVKEKVEALKKNPKAFIGIVTDKTDTSIQIKDIQGKIELVSITPDTTHFSKIEKTEIDIKYTDIAIGDYVSALGTFGSANVLNARRVILSPAPSDDRKIVSGKVDSIVKKEITVSSKDSTTTMVFPSRWKGPEIKEISEGNAVAAVATEKDGKLTIRTIEILVPPQQI